MKNKHSAKVFRSRSGKIGDTHYYAERLRTEAGDKFSALGSKRSPSNADKKAGALGPVTKLVSKDTTPFKGGGKKIVKSESGAQGKNKTITTTRKLPNGVTRSEKQTKRGLLDK